MPTLYLSAVVVLTTAAVAVLTVQLRRTRRALAAAQAHHRISDQTRHRDLHALQRHIHQTATAAAVLAAADHVLDHALATHTRDPKEGGSI